jgi:hypothetical protein
MKIITSFAPAVHINERASIEKRTKRLLKTQLKEVYRADLESASPEYKLSLLRPVSFYSRRVRDNFGTVCTVRGNKRNVSPGFARLPPRRSSKRLRFRNQGGLLSDVNDCF